MPKLRFKGFNKEWILTKVLDFAPLQRGFDLPVIEIKEGNYPVVFSNGILKTHSEYKAKAPGVVTGRSGTIGKVTFVEQDYWPHNTSLWVTDFKGNVPKFVYYFYVNLKLENFGTGSGVPTLNRNDVHAQSKYIPSPPEQEKIAAFLGAVDEKIQQLTRKKQLLEQYKKGIMQQLFSGKLRFKPDGVAERSRSYPKWEEKKLGDLLDYIQPTKYLVESTEYDDSYKTPVLTAGKTFILGYTNETKNIFCENLPVIIFDDFTTATQFVDFPFKAKSSAMKILVAKENENIRFIYESMQLIKFEVGGHGRHWISQFALMNINYPCLEEQKKIADFLSAIDAKINKVAEAIEATNQFKKGLLQQMFV